MNVDVEYDRESQDVGINTGKDHNTSSQEYLQTRRRLRMSLPTVNLPQIRPPICIFEKIVNEVHVLLE